MNKNLQYGSIAAVLFLLWQSRKAGANSSPGGGSLDSGSGASGDGSEGDSKNDSGKPGYVIDVPGQMSGTTIPKNVWRWYDLVRKMAESYPYAGGIPSVMGVIWQESIGDPRAIGLVGEVGLMQITPANFKKFGFTVSDMKTPEINIALGLQILKECQEEVGRWFSSTGTTVTGIGGLDFQCYNGGPKAIGLTSGPAYKYAGEVTQKTGVVLDYMVKIGYFDEFL